MRRFRFLLVCVYVVCTILCGCGSSNVPAGGSESVAEPKPAKVLTFSKMKATTETRTGFFGGRYASFEVTGKVTNNTDYPVNADNFPSLVWDSGSAEVEISQEKLLSRESCKVTWKQELSFEGSSIPKLSFSGDLEFVGLDECQADLNTQMQEIANGYASKDAKKDEERKAKEKAKADAAQKTEDEKSALAACKGMAASEAYTIAKETEFEPKFIDSYDVDVTEDVKSAENDSEIGKALVSEAEVNEAGWFSDASVTFTIDYTDPAAKKKRDDKAAAEATKKQADKDIVNCKGKPADEALEIANKSSYDPSFVDSYGVDVTKDVKDGTNGSDVHSAVVTKVELTEAEWFSNATATFTLDYTDPKAAKKREEEEKRRQEEKLRAKSRDAIEEAEGKSVGEIQELVDSGGFVLFIQDEYGRDITEKVRTSKGDSKIRQSKVIDVFINDGGSNPSVYITIDYADPASIKKYAEERGYPAEVTFSNIKVEIEDEDPASDNPTYFVTVTGTIASNDTWEVGEYYLPALGTETESLNRCAGIQLEGGVSVLNGGDTKDFTYHYRLHHRDTRVMLKTENDGVIMHGADELTSIVESQFEDAKKIHDANVDQAKEDERQSFEEQRRNATCYYTESGSCYHAYTGCPALSRSKNIYETTVGQAESWGLEACDRCH